MVASQTNPTCSECGYELTGLPAIGECPECGKLIRHSLLRGPDPRAYISRQAVWLALAAMISSVVVLLLAPAFLALAVVRIIRARRRMRDGTLPRSEQPFVIMAMVFSVMAATLMSIMAVVLFG